MELLPWHLIGCLLRCQPIRRHDSNSKLTNIEFNMDISYRNLRTQVIIPVNIPTCSSIKTESKRCDQHRFDAGMFWMLALGLKQCIRYLLLGLLERGHTLSDLHRRIADPIVIAQREVLLRQARTDILRGDGHTLRSPGVILSRGRLWGVLVVGVHAG